MIDHRPATTDQRPPRQGDKACPEWERGETRRQGDGTIENPKSKIQNPKSRGRPTTNQHHPAPAIELHIEELVLHGFPAGDREAIGAAVQRELTRLFAEQGVHPSLRRGYEVEKVDGGAFHVKQGAKAEGIGAQIGQAVYSGLER